MSGDGSRAELHGEELKDMLIGKYAIGAMTAKDVCLIAHHASMAGAMHDGLRELGFMSESGDGHYERHLKATLGYGPEAPLCSVKVPMYFGGRRQDTPREPNH